MKRRKITWKIVQEITHAQCGNYGNSLSPIFGKNFVKAAVLLKKLLNNWFDEIFFKWERISHFSTLWHCRHYYCGKREIKYRRKISRQINFSVSSNSSVKTLISRNFAKLRRRKWKIYSHKKKVKSTLYLVISLNTW